MTKLNFSFFENQIELRNISTLFTILCFLLLINALNMFDGINLQVGVYCLIIFLIFFFKNLFPILSLIVIISLILFLYYNFKNKAYLEIMEHSLWHLLFHMYLLNHIMKILL